MQLIGIGDSIRNGREIRCLLYAEFFNGVVTKKKKKQILEKGWCPTVLLSGFGVLKIQCLVVILLPFFINQNPQKRNSGLQYSQHGLDINKALAGQNIAWKSIWTIMFLFQLIPSLFQPIQAYSSISQPIPAYPSLFQPSPAYSSLFQPIPALFQHISSYFSLFQPL